MKGAVVAVVPYR
jgi:hypothetical protein